MWVVLVALFACNGPEDSDPAETDAPVDSDVGPGAVIVDVETTLGPFAIALDLDAAPVTAENFLGYVDAGYYDGRDGLGATIFHRVIPDFVAQGGGQTPDGAQKATGAPITLESDNGLSNRRGTIAMARTNNPDSATTQFFVNLVDNGALDHQSEAEPGYAVFGEVIEGMGTIDAIAAAPRAGEQPVTDIVINACERR